jgi:hypothetical protein
MTNRENQLRLDLISMQYLAAVDGSDFETLEALWLEAQDDPDLSEMLHELNAEIVTEQDASRAAITKTEIDALFDKYMPSAEVIRPEPGPLTVAQVAGYLRKHPSVGMTADDLAVNERLCTSSSLVPLDLGMQAVASWGRQFGLVPESYWKAFRQVALLLRMRRESAENYQMAARPTKPPSKPKGDQP